MKEPRKYRQGKRIRFDGPDREWLYYQYHELGKSAPEISRESNAATPSVMAWMRKLNIQPRTIQDVGARHSERMFGAGNPAWNGGTSRSWHGHLLGTHKEKQCEWCGTVHSIQVHHIDHNTKNGNLDNLMWLCHHCNILEAHLHGLQEKGRIVTEHREGRLIITFTSWKLSAQE